MLKRRLAACAVLCAMFLFPAEAWAADGGTAGNGKVSVTVSEQDPCAAVVEWHGTGDPDVRLRIARTDGTGGTYTYRLAAGEETRVTFTQGSGTYGLTVLQHTHGKYYSVVYATELEIDGTDPWAAFLGSTVMVSYDGGEAFIGTAGELCGGCGSRTDAIAAVYGYVVDYMSYDRDKAKEIVSGAWTGGAVPDLDGVYDVRKGVCYDIAGLTTAMLRSQGVPCMLVYGYAGGFYHAWCMVMPDEDGVIGGVAVKGGEWSLVDPTFGLTNERIVRTYLSEGKYEPVLAY